METRHREAIGEGRDLRRRPRDALGLERRDGVSDPRRPRRAVVSVAVLARDDLVLGHALVDAQQRGARRERLHGRDAEVLVAAVEHERLRTGQQFALAGLGDEPLEGDVFARHRLEGVAFRAVAGDDEPLVEAVERPHDAVDVFVPVQTRQRHVVVAGLGVAGRVRVRVHRRVHDPDVALGDAPVPEQAAFHQLGVHHEQVRPVGVVIVGDPHRVVQK